MRVFMPNQYIITVKWKTYEIRKELKNMWFWRDWDMWIIDRDDWIWSSRIEDSLIKEVEKITNTKVIKNNF